MQLFWDLIRIDDDSFWNSVKMGGAWLDKLVFRGIYGRLCILERSISAVCDRSTGWGGAMTITGWVSTPTVRWNITMPALPLINMKPAHDDWSIDRHAANVDLSAKQMSQNCQNISMRKEIDQHFRKYFRWSQNNSPIKKQRKTKAKRAKLAGCRNLDAILSSSTGCRCHNSISASGKHWIYQSIKVFSMKRNAISISSVWPFQNAENKSSALAKMLRKNCPGILLFSPLLLLPLPLVRFAGLDWNTELPRWPHDHSLARNIY